MNELTIKINTNPAIDDAFIFIVYINGTPTNIIYTFKTLRGASNQSTIGANTTDTATNLKNALILDYNQYLIVSSSTNEVVIRSRTNEYIYGYSNLVGSTLSFTDSLIDQIEDIQVRSPYLYINPKNSLSVCNEYQIETGATASMITWQDCATQEFDNYLVATNSIFITPCAATGSIYSSQTATVSISSTCSGTFSWDGLDYGVKVFTGDIYFDKPVDNTWDISKLKIASTQTNLFTNLSNLTRDGLEGDIDTYLNTTSFTASQPIGDTESKWMVVDSTFKEFGDNIEFKEISDTFHVLDGYLNPDEIYPLDNNVLMTPYANTSVLREVYRGSHMRIHFKIKDLLNISYTSDTESNVSVSFDTTWKDNSKYIQSLLVKTSAQRITYTFNYVGETWSILITTKPECKFNPVECYFKNKHGVIETLTFNKKNSSSTNTTKTEFKRGIVDMNGNYNINRHTDKDINIMGEDMIICNTDYISPKMNDAFRELLLSEEVWLKIDDVIYPVKLTDSNFIYKTSLNNGPTQYTMNFKKSHRSINNIK